MKKIISLILVLMLCISLGACGEGNPDLNMENSTSTSVTVAADIEDTSAVSITTTADSQQSSTAINTATQKVEQTTAQTESEEEKALKVTKERYENANKYLTKYLSEGSFYISGQGTLKDNAALKYLYKEFEACGDYEDSRAILTRFAVLPDALMSITVKKTDYLNNEITEKMPFYLYDANGAWIDYHDIEYSDIYDIQYKVVNLTGFYVLQTENKEYINRGQLLDFLGFSFDEVAYGDYIYQYETDSLERVNVVKAFAGGKLIVLIKLEYDSVGNITKSTIQTTGGNTYTNTYTYNAKNELIDAKKYLIHDILNANFAPQHSIVYSYNNSGNLVQEVDIYEKAGGFIVGYYKNEMRETVYVYDKNGNLSRKEFRGYHNNPNVPNYTSIDEYSYDKNGYIVKLTNTKSARMDMYSDCINICVEELYYTNDENGKPISAELIETENGKNKYASQILTYNYEDIYFYNAE